jgi:hypothetical protein
MADVLVSEAEQLMPAHPFVEQPSLVTVKHTEAGANKRTSKLCFVPKDYNMNTKIVDLVQTQWDLDLPNLLVQCDFGTAHPTSLGTPALMKLPQFKEWLVQSKRHHAAGATKRAAAAAAAGASAVKPAIARRSEPAIAGPAIARKRSSFLKWMGGASVHPSDLKEGDGTTGAESASPASAEVTQADVTREDVDLINTLVFQKLITTMSSVVDACAMSNNWLVVNRLEGSSATADLMLEFALERTAARPTVLVIDSMSRLHEHTSQATADHVAELRGLRAQAVPLGIESLAQGQAVGVEWPYVPDNFQRPEDYYELPYPREPFKEHILADGTVAEKRRWMYHYEQYIFGAGTHYIILEDDNDVFEVEKLGGMGTVVAHGGTLMYHRLRQKMQKGQPLVMLYNTGGATQAFASIVRSFRRAQARRLELPRSEHVLEDVEIVSSENWAATFGIPEIMLMKELTQRAPLLFRKTVVTVDLVNDSAEDVLETLTGCFAGSASGVPQLGLGAAEANVVCNAWRRYLVLITNARTFKRTSDAIEYLVQLTAIATTIVSVLYTVSNFSMGSCFDADVDAFSYPNLSSAEPYLQICTGVLPFATALLVALRSRLRSREKWTDCLAAAAQIASEIYKYRARAMEYDPFLLSQPSAEDEKKKKKKKEAAAVQDERGVDKNKKSKDQRARDTFIERVQAIYASPFSGELSSAGALRHGPSLAASDEEDDVGRAAFLKVLRKEWQENGAGGIKGAAQVAKTVNADGAASLDDRTEANEVKDEDDLLNSITIETYIDFRVRPFALRLEQHAPAIARRLQLLESTVFLVNTASGVLAVLPGTLATYVAICVTISATISAIIEYHNLPRRVPALNTALRDVHNLLTWWAGLTLVDRRTRLAKQHMVSTLEAASLSLITAVTVKPTKDAASGQKMQEGEH